jgi:hypothetical protein
MDATVAKIKKIGTAPSKTNLFGVKAPRPLFSPFFKRAIRDPVPERRSMGEIMACLREGKLLSVRHLPLKPWDNLRSLLFSDTAISHCHS